MTQTGVIDFYLHPPIGLLEPQLDYHGPYSGNVTVDHWSSTAGPVFTDHFVSASYGVEIQLNGAIPIGWGFTNGWISDDTLYDESVYELRLLQLIIQHEFPGGQWVTTQRADVRTFPSVVFWDVALPGRLGLLVAPGLSFDLSFLVTI